MRYLKLFFYLIYFISCKNTLQSTSIPPTKVSIATCPDNGVCSYQFIKNKALNIKQDNFGSIYPEINDGNDLVLQFEYKKQSNSNHKDSNYREQVFIALDKKKLECNTENLKDKNIYFARLCYCKGQTGYYKIKQGKISVVKIGPNQFKMHLTFKIDEVPQVINEISYIFNLD